MLPKNWLEDVKDLQQNLCNGLKNWWSVEQKKTITLWLGLLLVVLLVPRATIMDKSLGTLLHFWGVFQFTQVQTLPSPHKQCWMYVSRIFFRVSTLYRVGGGRTARKFRKGCTVLRGNREMTEKYEYCSTVPRTFVQDCRSRFSPSHWSPKGWGIEREGKREGHFPPPPRLPMPFSAAATQASSPQNSNPRAPRCFSG